MFIAPAHHLTWTERSPEMTELGIQVASLHHSVSRSDSLRTKSLISFRGEHLHHIDFGSEVQKLQETSVLSLK